MTDNSGASTSTTQQVTAVAPVNVPPVAAFTSTVNNLSVAVDGSGSTDPDGTVASYSWDFGDSSALGTGATVSHSYAAAGTYTVALTVTDNSGAINTITHSVTVTAPSPTAPFATDAFGRTVASGLGTADIGGAWTTSGSAANFAVGGGVATLKNTTAGSSNYGYLNSVSSTDTEVQATVATQQTPTGSGTYTSIIGRRVGTDDYRMRVGFLVNGNVNVEVDHAGAALQAVRVAGLSYVPGTLLQARLQVFGTNPTTIRAKVWVVGTTEPTAWQISKTDSTAALQAPGSIGIGSFLGGTSTTLPTTTTFANLWAGPLAQ